MRAHTKGKHEMGKRFAIVASAWIGSIALVVMVLGAAWLAAAPQAVGAAIAHGKACDRKGHLWVSGVSCHNAKGVARHHDNTGDPRFNGWKCDDDSRWQRFETTCHRPRKGETQRIAYTTNWRDTRHAALGAQTASAGEPVDSVPPDLQLSGPKKQKLNKAVEVKASCGDEACQVGARSAKLTNLGVGGLRFPNGDPKGPILKEGLGGDGADLAPGETTTLKLELNRNSRKAAGKALAEGRNVQAKVIIEATTHPDTPGPVATAKRTIRLVK